MSAQTRAILDSYFETGDKPSQAQFVALIDSFLNFASDFGILFGHLNQAGVAAPTLSNIFSTLSWSPTFSYVGVGEYKIESVGNMDSAKTFIFIGTTQDTIYPVVSFPDTSPDAYTIFTIDNAQNPSDVLLTGVPILILQLP